MRPLERAATIAGFLLVLTTLLLASPGVQVVRAAEAASSQPGATCDAAPRYADADAEVEAFLVQLRSQHPSASRAAGVPVALNIRGYNLGPPPSHEFGLIELDARLQRQR
jgi:hypothetical protein